MEGARPASSADVARLAELHETALAELSTQKGGRLWAAERGRTPEGGAALFDAALLDPAALLLAGTIDDAVVGYALVRTEVLPTGDRLAVLSDLYVEPDFRDVAVGEAMMDAVLDWSGAAGCAGVDAVALPGARATKNFFERYGLTARAIVVHRRLGRDDA